MASPTTRPLSERLQALVACHQLALGVYRAAGQGQLLRDYPELAGELRKAALSAAVRIMEGAGRSPPVFRRHLAEAGGKLARLSAGFAVARDLLLLSPEQFTELEIQRDHAERLTWGLWRAVGQRQPRPNGVSGVPRTP